jgi:hypothetical protein
MHVTVENARDLMNAHQSAKTWAEQSRRLMELRPQVEEISEDLKASGQLFDKQTEIVAGLEAIISYLLAARDEYRGAHQAVDSGHKAGKELRETIAQNKMTWVSDFMDSGENFQRNYESNLTNSKGAMRREVYGD